jgi:ElaA protein
VPLSGRASPPNLPSSTLTRVPPPQWLLKPFDALTPSELYDALALRQRVFVVEQRCAYLDCDGLDRAALHLLGRASDGALVAYARLLPPGVAYAEGAIGRVVTDTGVRGTGLGRALMREAIARMRSAYPGALQIGAQAHLQRFYGELGFVTVGEPYEEDGIPHVHMLLAAP